MKGRKNSREKRHMGKKTKIMLYSAFTLLLTCLVVTGYYLISNGVIFGKFTVKSNTYKMGKISGVDQKKTTVTPQSMEGAVPLTSDDQNLPAIPPSSGKKLSKENPFVVLEIVPELSQQSLAYLVDSEEKGLPFNPVELGTKFCNEDESWNKNGYLDGSRKNIISEGDVANQLMNKGGYFQNELWNKITNAKGEVVNYYEIKFLYEFNLYSSDMNVSEEDFKNKTMHQLYEENKEAFALAFPDKFATEKDADGNIISVTCTDRSFEFALNEKNKDGNYTDRNWIKTIEENKDISRSFKFTIPASAGLTDEDLTLSMEQLAAKYPALFETSDSGAKVPADIMAKDKKWVKNRIQQTNQFTKGYFVKVEPGTGEYTLNGYEQWRGFNPMTATKTGTDTDMWNYVDSEAYPPEYLEVSNYYWNEQWNIDNKLREPGGVGTFIRLTYTPMNEDIGQWFDVGRIVQMTADVYTFDYAKYVYSFKYAGLKINELLKYALFERDEQKDYDEMNLQVITVTPEMINEMDANDEENTLDYIERADLFYINEMYDGHNISADSKELSIAIDFYNKYCTESGKKVDLSKKENIKTFYETDLEWFDCLKIIKRLSTNRNLPMMMTKLVGSMGNNGVDGKINSKIFVDDGHRAVEVAGMLNNISKLQLILAQFDLVDSTVFMETIFPQLMVMELNPDQQDKSKFPAKYTGYYERLPLPECPDSEDYKKRCYYLWNKFTFLPTNLKDFFPHNIGDGDFDDKGQLKGTLASLVEEYGFLESFFWNYMSHGAYDTLYQNPNDIGSTQALPRIDGSDGNDMKNVTFVSNQQSTNINMGVLSEFTTNRMLDILKKILDNVSSTADELTIQLKENKKEYVKVAADQALLDYTGVADYRTVTKTKKVNLKIGCSNPNNEDAVIRELTFVKQPEDVSGKSTVLQNEAKNMQLEKIAFSNGSKPLDGYRIPAEDKTSSYYVPLTLSDWQQGYRILKIEWTARRKIEKRSGKVEYVSKEGTDIIYIGERGLSNLE